MENKMEKIEEKIDEILNDLGFENVITPYCRFDFIYEKEIIMGSVTAKYTIEFDNFVSVIHLNIFGMDYKMNFNNKDLIKENAIIDAMLKILIKAEKTRTRIYDNFVGEINDLK